MSARFKGIGSLQRSLLQGQLQAGANQQDKKVQKSKVTGQTLQVAGTTSAGLLFNCLAPSLQYLDKSLLEKVQHRFTRLFPHLRGLPYEERLHQLRLWSLEECWNRADLLETFKMVKGIAATPWSVFFHRAEDKITRSHSLKLVKNHCHCNTRLQFFSQRVINRWNSLTEEDISVSSVNCFKNSLEKRRNHQMDFFKDG